MRTVRDVEVATLRRAADILAAMLRLPRRRRVDDANSMHDAVQMLRAAADELARMRSAGPEGMRTVFTFGGGAP